MWECHVTLKITRCEGEGEGKGEGRRRGRGIHFTCLFTIEPQDLTSNGYVLMVLKAKSDSIMQTFK